MDPPVHLDIGRDIYYILSLHDRALMQTIQLSKLQIVLYSIFLFNLA